MREIKKRNKTAELRFWCDRKFAPQAKSIMGNFDKDIVVSTIMAGKFRRYNHVSFLRQLLWPSVVLMNFRDVFFVIFGFIQSFFKLIVWRPDVVFTKGGYVCLPVGIAAKLLGIPLVIHDSDAHPGLTNRVLARWADWIGTGAPLEFYNYPASKAKYVGIPISDEFKQFSKAQQIDAKKQWDVDPKKPLVVITGGGLGAKRVNDLAMDTRNDLAKFCTVVLLSGAGQYDELRQIAPKNTKDFQLHAFVSKGMASLLGAADVVVSRAGATATLELAALVKPTILMPNGKLTGGHQLKNAMVYEKGRAVIVLDENKLMEEPQDFVKAIKKLIDNPSEAMEMAKRFNKFARPEAAKDMADMVLSLVK